MINVLHIIDTAGPGGAETVFLQTTTRIDPARFQSAAVIGDTGWLAKQLQETGLSPRIVPAKGSFNARYLSTLLRLARHHRSDVIAAHLYGSSVYASLVGRLLSIPVVSVLHGQSDVPHTERFASLKAAIIRRGSRRVVFVSERLEEHLRPRLGLAGEQCTVIANGVDTEVFRRAPDRSLRAELRLPDDAALIGAIGNVREPKAYDVLLRAARTLTDRPQRFHLVIAGDCANALGKQLQQLSRDLGMERHVTFLGLRADVSRILNNLDVFVLSSHTEGFSIACIEAMACGIPVIATRSGGPEQILAGEAGLLVPTGDYESLARDIERVISSKDLAATLTARALRRVHEQYSLATMLSRYESLLEQVARPPPRSTASR
ncbi:MAG TPA: glycosyltransferase [Steroidobacteraceae bacterium]|nr:glycosyltransferase [Steroidobacteraceae bacterium]